MMWATHSHYKEMKNEDYQTDSQFYVCINRYAEMLCEFANARVTWVNLTL